MRGKYFQRRLKGTAMKKGQSKGKGRHLDVPKNFLAHILEQPCDLCQRIQSRGCKNENHIILQKCLKGVWDTFARSLCA